MSIQRDYLVVFRENVAAILKKRHVTITQVAKDLGMSRPSLSVVLNGRGGITLFRAGRIADYLDLPLGKLLK